MAILCSICGMPIDGTEPASDLCPRCRLDVAKPAVKNAPGWQTTSLALKAQFGILVIFLGAAAAILMRIEPPPGDGAIFACMGVVLLLGYFLALCMLGSSPDPTARRSALACVLTLVFGTIGMFASFAVLSRPADFGMSEEVIGPMLGFGIFTIYFSAFVFLMRFHAVVARAFGNRRLRRQCYAYVFAPALIVAVNVVFFWLTEPFFFGRRGRVPFGAPHNLLLMAQTAFNFGVAGWYLAIVWQTFRTIDRGPVAETGERRPRELDDDDLSID
jgi:hypothetical protein